MCYAPVVCDHEFHIPLVESLLTKISITMIIMATIIILWDIHETKN